MEGGPRRPTPRFQPERPRRRRGITTQRLATQRRNPTPTQRPNATPSDPAQIDRVPALGCRRPDLQALARETSPSSRNRHPTLGHATPRPNAHPTPKIDHVRSGSDLREGYLVVQAGQPESFGAGGLAVAEQSPPNAWPPNAATQRPPQRPKSTTWVRTQSHRVDSLVIP